MTATEQEVGSLHKKVTKRLIREVEDEKSPVGWTQAAISFLKANDCTMSGEQQGELSDLRERIDRRARRARVFATNIRPIRPDLAMGDD